MKISPRLKATNSFRKAVSILVLLLIAATVGAQCTNWGIKATLVNASSCTGNGSFKVTLTGPDTANLTNIQYGIPINVNGFSLPLNNSAIFTGIPPGTYTVSAVALCGGTYVGKNTSIVMPGNYMVPTLGVPGSTPTPVCVNKGTVNVNVNNGLGPYTFRLNALNGTLLATRVTGNSFTTFDNLAEGSYTVNVLDACGSGTASWPVTVSRSNPITTVETWPTFTCTNSGKVSGTVSGGLPPYTLKLSLGSNIVATQTSASGTYLFSNLGAGNYSLSLTDACGTPGGASFIFVDSLNPVAMPLAYAGTFENATCDSFSLSHPYLNIGNRVWNYYYTDPSFKLSIQINGGLLAPTPYIRLNQQEPRRAIPAGKTLKDYYGKTITYTLQHPCGTDIIYTVTIPYPAVLAGYEQNCNLSMRPMITFDQNVCYPVTYTMTNSASGQTYGPITITQSGTNAPDLPFGDYTIAFQTADGYSGTGIMHAIPGTGNPYSVRIGSEAKGFHNYIEYFDFFTNSNTARPVKIELFNGPAGYTYSISGMAYNNGSYPFARIKENQSPSGNSNLYFPPGYYVWKLTDDCGTYFVPMTITTNDLYQFTINATLEQTCTGLKVTPFGTARHLGTDVAVYFSLLKNGRRVLRTLPDGSYMWDNYSIGSPIYITEPGDYTILTSAEPSPNHSQLWMYYFYPFEYPKQYPNAYTRSYSFTYNTTPLKVDVNRSQAFICIGEGLGQGKIYAQGQGGIPFTYPSPAYYRYSLALQGQGATGPYIAQNNTGVFNNFAGSANSIYDVKVEDTCGASAIQSLKILDLATTRLISSNHYATCALDSIQLVALYLPNATYSWAGPNGFTSTLRNPVIPHASMSNVGVYYVTITTTLCNGAIKDSTVLSLNPNPPKPVASLSCGPDAVSLTIINPFGGIRYAWNVGNYYSTSISYYQEPSDTANIKYVYDRGNYTPVAIDSNTGCKTYGDTTFFTTDPNMPFKATIASPHLKLCTGDNTTLTAELDSMINLFVSYQWYKDNVAIPGATSVAISVNTPGSYKVLASSPPCKIDTSAAVNVTVVPPPTATITAPILQICEGDTAYITGNTGAGYTYTWHLDNNTIPAFFGPVLPAVKAGDYYATVSNGACVANSNTIHITVNPAPVVRLLPDVDQFICHGDTVYFSTPANPAYTYQWQRNGTTIPNVQGNIYGTSLAGAYRVIVSTPTCPNVISATVPITILPGSIQLRNDTTICNSDPFSIPLSADAVFDNYIWSNGQNSREIMVSQPGTYWVRATNKCGTVADTVHIHALTEYLPHFPKDTLICNPSNVATLRVPQLLQQSIWSTGATGNSIQVTEPGIYWVTGTSPCGAINDTINVRFCPPVIRSINLSRDSICEGDCISLTETTENYPQTYQWNFSGTLPDSSDRKVPEALCYQVAGTYLITLKVTNAGGSDTYTTHIVVQQKPAPRFADTTMIISYKTNVSIPACATAQKIDWYRDGVLVCSDCEQIKVEAKDYRAVYHCIVSNGGCVDSCLYKMQVIDIPNDVWLPDAFTPNGDGRNDAFHIITDNPNIHAVELTVYNRWGQKLYISHTTKDGWDGRINGADADLGTYFWTLKYKVLGSEEFFFKKGDIVLVR